MAAAALYCSQRGGRHQRSARVAAVASAVASHTVESQTAAYLLEQAAWRRVSPQLCQQVCALVRRDVAVLVKRLVPDHDEPESVVDQVFGTLRKCAYAGNQGRYANNVNRSITSILGESAVPWATSVAVPLTVSGSVVKPVLQQMHFPHTVFSSIYHNDYRNWLKYVCPSGDRLQAFWDSVEHHPNMPLLKHELQGVQGWRRRLVPLKLHGDDVPIVGTGKAWSKAMSGHSITSLVGEGSTLECCYLIWGVMADLLNSSTIAARDSRQVYGKWLVWALMQCWTGKVANTDPSNRQCENVGANLFGNSGMSMILWISPFDLDLVFKDSRHPWLVVI